MTNAIASETRERLWARQPRTDARAPPRGKAAMRCRSCRALRERVAPSMQVYPGALQFLSRGGANILAILWFGTLFLLGIDSMFALVEGIATVITDTPRFHHLRKETVAAVMCAAGFVGSVGFVSDIGRPLLDAVDHYVVNYGLFVTGALEALTVSWVWGWRETEEKCGRTCGHLILYMLSYSQCYHRLDGGSSPPEILFLSTRACFYKLRESTPGTVVRRTSGRVMIARASMHRLRRYRTALSLTLPMATHQRTYCKPPVFNCAQSLCMHAACGAIRQSLCCTQCLLIPV